MDGDEVLAMWGCEIVACFAESPPREEPRKPPPPPPPLPARSHEVQYDKPDKLAEQLSCAYLDLKYLSMDVLGKSAYNILALSQWYGPAHKNVCKLIDFYNTGLDAGKTGEKVQPTSPISPYSHLVPSYTHRILTLPRTILCEQVVMAELNKLCIKEYPVFMEGRSADPTISYVEEPKSLPCGALSLSHECTAPTILCAAHVLHRCGRPAYVWRDSDEQALEGWRGKCTGRELHCEARRRSQDPSEAR